MRLETEEFIEESSAGEVICGNGNFYYITTDLDFRAGVVYKGQWHRRLKVETEVVPETNEVRRIVMSHVMGGECRYVEKVDLRTGCQALLEHFRKVEEIRVLWRGQ